MKEGDVGFFMKRGARNRNFKGESKYLNSGCGDRCHSSRSGGNE